MLEGWALVASGLESLASVPVVLDIEGPAPAPFTAVTVAALESCGPSRSGNLVPMIWGQRVRHQWHRGEPTESSVECRHPCETDPSLTHQEYCYIGLHENPPPSRSYLTKNKSGKTNL